MNEEHKRPSGLSETDRRLFRVAPFVTGSWALVTTAVAVYLIVSYGLDLFALFTCLLAAFGFYLTLADRAISHRLLNGPDATPLTQSQALRIGTYAALIAGAAFIGLGLLGLSKGAVALPVTALSIGSVFIVIGAADLAISRKFEPPGD